MQPQATLSRARRSRLLTAVRSSARPRRLRRASTPCGFPVARRIPSLRAPLVPNLRRQRRSIWSRACQHGIITIAIRQDRARLVTVGATISRSQWRPTPWHQSLLLAFLRRTERRPPRFALPGARHQGLPTTRFTAQRPTLRLLRRCSPLPWRLPSMTTRRQRSGQPITIG